MRRFPRPGPSSIRPISSRTPRGGRIIRFPTGERDPDPRCTEHAAEGVRPHPAARIDERRAVLPVRRVLAEPVDSALEPGRRRCEPSSVGGGPDGHHFVVDLDSAEGLKRVSPGALGHALYLDASPLLALIDAEIESLRDPLNASAHPVIVRVRPAGQVAAQGRRQLLAAPASRQSSRRTQACGVDGQGRHRPRAHHADAAARGEEEARGRPAAVPEVEEITITVDGGYTQSAGESWTPKVHARTRSGLEFGVPHHFWQLKDRSASGCRLRAPVADASKVSPGTLVAIRDDETMRWSLVVVRRLKTRIGDRIDIGVEYVGQNPRGVTMALEAHVPSHGTHRPRTRGAPSSPPSICAKARSSRRCPSRRSSWRAPTTGRRRA